MKKFLFLLILLCIEKALHAQYVYTIKADSVKITNTCDTAELIIENHTQNVPGFLYNKGRGRTEFRKGLQKINDLLYLVGDDSLKMPNAWLQGGNTFGTTGILGTRDNNHIDLYTNNIKRGRLDSIGRFSLDFAPNQLYDAFSLTTGNGTKKWFYIQGSSNNSTISMSTNNDNVGALECMRLTAGGQSSTIETFAYSDLSVKGWGGLDLYGGYGGGSTKYIRFFPAANLAGSFMANGNFVLGNTTTDKGNRFQVNGTSWFGDEVYAGSDSYYIQLKPAYSNGYGTGIDASMITFGNIRASIGVNKQHKGNIPVNSLLIGGVPPEYWTTIVDYNVNPTFITSGAGAVTINGGYNGISLGGSTGVSANATSYPFNIYGGRGTGSGTPGDINFFTGNAQQSGTTIHAMTTRWIMKGGTGYLSNSFNPTSVLDITGTNGYSQLRLRSTYSPSSTSDVNGNVGDISWDDNNFYLKTSTGWKAAPLSTSFLTMNEVLNTDLAVNGAVSAQKMWITQTGRWPDYVFSKQYQLPALSEVEKFIKQNNHLPGVPSAADVEKKGIDVGGNQAALLQKIEELTLYVIDQDKKLQKQNKELRKQNNQISTLKQQNKELELLKKQMAELMTLIKKK